MIYKNEKQLLIIIRFALPLLILILSIAITTFLYFENKTTFDEIKKDTEERFIQTKKQIIKDQINNMYSYVIEEQLETEKNLKKSLITRVNEAHKIIVNLYNQYKDTLSKEEMIPMFRAAIKDIRFNNNRGYFFVYDKKATNIIHPLVPKLEGKNLINYQDTKGTYVLRESLELLENNDHSYQEWYWRKSKQDMKEYKKIGFVKNIYELDWFLGTGEYVEDFSKDIQKKVLTQVEKLKFGENGYFIITDGKNNYLSHINKNLIGKNALKALQDMNDMTSLKKIQKVINEKKGYIYLDFYKPSSTTISSKIIYMETIPKWEWRVSTGFYTDDAQKEISKQKEILTKNYTSNINNLFVIALLSTFVLLLLSFYISTLIERKFKQYKLNIQKHVNENKKQHDIISQKSKLAAMGEMMENIAHQWRQPLSIITTASTGIKINKEMDNLESEFLDTSIDSITSSARYLTETIEDFRDFFKPNRERTTFTLKNSIEKTNKLLSSQLRNKNIKLVLNIEDIVIEGFERELLQVFLNIINNAKDAIETNENLQDDNKFIFINTYNDNDYIIIEIKDNAGGIDEDLKDRIFEPYFTTKHQSQGTGIGLYMSQEIVSRHMQGTIEVINSTYEFKGNSYVGALFTIKIPNK